MSIGENIKAYRVQRGMTQKALGIAIGFDKSSADVRIAQYESGARTPRPLLLNSIASVLDVDITMLSASDTASRVRLLATLDSLEELCAFVAEEIADMRTQLKER